MGVIFGAIVAAVVLGLYFFKKQSPSHLKTAEERDSISFKEVMTFFNDKGAASILEKNSNIKAVVIKKVITNRENKIHLVCALFDTKKDEIVQDESKCFLNLLVNSIDEDFVDAFGDKDMIVLEIE